MAEEQASHNELTLCISNFCGKLSQYVVGPFSPLSIISSLLPVIYGANGNTLVQLLNLFGISDKKEVEQLIDQLHIFKSTLGDTKLICGSFVKDQYPIKAMFTEIIKKLGEVQNVDFSNADAVKDQINSWVSSETKEQIPRLVPDGVITKDNVFVLVNALHFKGTWVKEFYPAMYGHENGKYSFSETFKFTTLNNTEKVLKVMQVDTKLMHYEDEHCHVVGIPCTNGHSMRIVLPKGKFGLFNIADFNGKLKKTKILLRMPMFKVRYRVPVKQILQQLGVIDLFTKGVANLSEINSDANIYIDEIMHEVVLNVDEIGIEGVAATAVSAKAEAYKMPINILINRTFQYAFMNDRGMIFFHDVYDGKNDAQ